MDSQYKLPKRHEAAFQQYCEDWKKSRRPWENWQTRCIGAESWVGLNAHPTWHEKQEYRRKPKMLTINGIEFPEPMSEPPQFGDIYYYVNFFAAENVGQQTWRNTKADFALLNKRVVQKTVNGANAQARAFLSLLHTEQSE